MALTLRVRHSKGVATVTLPQGFSLEELRSVCCEAAGVSTSVHDSRLLHGFPRPSLLVDTSLIRSGDTLVVEELEQAAAPSAPTPAAAPVPTEPAAPQPARSLSSVPLDDGRVLLHRVVPSDNSCLFTSLAVCLLQSTERRSELREICGAAVLADSHGLYTDDYLGKPREAYASWVMLPSSWGGAIELDILSSAFSVRIDAADVETRVVYRYGEASGYAERVLLLYSGLHYDAVTVAPFEEAPPDFQETRFSTNDQVIESAFRHLVANHHAAGQWTNTSNFTLRCTACHEGLIGEKEARLHALATGHTGFSEFRETK